MTKELKAKLEIEQAKLKAKRVNLRVYGYNGDKRTSETVGQYALFESWRRKGAYDAPEIESSGVIDNGVVRTDYEIKEPRVSKRVYRKQSNISPLFFVFIAIAFYFIATYVK